MRILTGVLVAGILAGAVYWFGFHGGGGTTDESGAPRAREFTLSDSHGRPLKLEAFRGKPVLLNFWATWCPPCLDELPSLLKLAEWSKKELGVETIAVSVDTEWGVIERFFAEKKLWSGASLPLTILLDADGKVASAYGSGKYPETYFIDRNFKIARKFVGPQNWMSQEITGWLKEHSK